MKEHAHETSKTQQACKLRGRAALGSPRRGGGGLMLVLDDRGCASEVLGVAGSSPRTA